MVLLGVFTQHASKKAIKLKKKMSFMISSNWIRDTFISTKKLSKQPIIQLIRLNPQNPQEEYVLGEFSDTNHFMRCVFTQNAIDNFASNEPERKFTKLNGSLLCLTDYEILNKEYLNFNHLVLSLTFREPSKIAIRVNSFNFISGEAEAMIGQPENIRTFMSNFREKEKRYALILTIYKNNLVSNANLSEDKSSCN